MVFAEIHGERVKLPHRGIDDFGSGAFAASRDGGTDTHNGIDYACIPDAKIFAPVGGKVTLLGYAYTEDLSFRYVQIRDDYARDHRIFYVSPAVAVGQFVTVASVIGTAQHIASKFNTGARRMKNHVHYEVRHMGKFFDPEALPETKDQPLKR